MLMYYVNLKEYLLSESPEYAACIISLDLKEYHNGKSSEQYGLPIWFVWWKQYVFLVFTNNDMHIQSERQKLVQ